MGKFEPRENNPLYGSNIMLFKKNSYTTKELKNKAVLSLNSIVYIAMWSLVA